MTRVAVSVGFGLFALLLATTPSRANPPGSGWTQVLGDEFNYSGAPDPTKWLTQFPSVHGSPNTNGNDRLASFAPDEPLVSGGWLYLWASRCSDDPINCIAGYPWKSSVITSKTAFLYGYMETRWQVSLDAGFHYGFWLLPLDGTWPPELDVVELGLRAFGEGPNDAQMGVHWVGPDGGNASNYGSYSGPDFSAGMHTFGMEWNPGSVRWFVDGVERFSTTSHVPQKPMYLIETLEIGPTQYFGTPPANLFADGGFIEFARVWQKCSGCNCNVYPVP